MLVQVVEQHIEKTITDEQAQRVLAPIREMIYEGKFSKPPRRKLKPIYIVAISATVIALILAVTLVLTSITGIGQVDLQETNIPLTELPSDLIPDT